jgi:hypothetical protein
LFADKASLARFPVYLGGFRFPPSSNLIHPRLGGLEMDEAKPMIVPKLVVVTKADWRMPANTRQSYSIHPSSLPKGRSMDEAPKSYGERQKEARAAGWSFSFGGRACLSLSRH